MPRKPVDLESSLQSRVANALRWSGCIVEVLSAGRRGGVRLCSAGTPDLLVLVPGGATVLMELKREDGSGRLEEDQIDWHRRAARIGHHVHVVDSQDRALAIVRAARGKA